MIFNERAVKWLAIDVIATIILYVIYFTTENGIFQFLAVLGSFAILVIPFVVMNKEEQEKGKKEAQELEQLERKRKLTEGYKCPSCGMMAGHKIDTISKGLSVGTLGLASNKIGKTYKCENCKYMW